MINLFPAEWLADLENAFGGRIPALRRMGVVVQVAARADQPGPFREGEMPAHRRTRHERVVLRERRNVHEVGTRSRLHVAAVAGGIVRMGAGVTAKPDIDRARVLGQIVFEELRKSVIDPPCRARPVL